MIIILSRSVVIEGMGDVSVVINNLKSIPGVKNDFDALIKAYAITLGISSGRAKSILADILEIGATNMNRLSTGKQRLTIQHTYTLVDHFNSKFSNDCNLPVWKNLENLVSKIEAELEYLTFSLLSRPGKVSPAAQIPTTALIERNNNYAHLGIVECTERLTDSPFVPQECMNKVKNRLCFLGVCGEKWVDEEIKRDQFREMLRRISNNRGTVKFLLIDPSSNSWSKLSGLRQENICNTSFFKYREFMDDFPVLEVRLYDTLPSFRLQFIDDEYVTVSRYKNEYEGWRQSKHGWEAPHVYIDNESESEKKEEEKVEDIKKPERHYWSLYPTFQALYEYVWQGAAELTHELLDPLDKII
jgi:hypothetical protein